MQVSRRDFIVGGTAVLSSRLIEGETTSPLSPFPYGAVELLEGPLKHQFDENHQFFSSLSEDRLLKIYRQRAGLPAPGDSMGGWYDDFCPGAHFGQYVSALARFAAITGSAPTKAKVSRLLEGFSQTIDPSGKFFVDLRYPSYTYDKHVCMLMDAHSLLNEPHAPAILRATTNAALPHMEPYAMTGEEQAKWRPQLDETHTWDEPYTISENLFLAGTRFGDRRYFELGKRYLQDRAFFDPLSRGENVLPGLHAYSHVNALSSGMQGYLQLGDRKYLHAVMNAVEMIWTDQSFATGGWGPNEGFVQPGKGLLAASLKDTHRSFETPCGAYAHFKVMRYLLFLTRDVRYGDSMEQVLYNTVLGAKPVRADGSSFYYSDYHSLGFKTYRRDIPGARHQWDHDGRWPCCSGTLPQVVADYTISTYFRGADGVYVNLYAPSRLTWKAEGAECCLTQETQYPTENLVTIGLTTSRSIEFALYLRVPAWAGPSTYVSINGNRQPGVITPGRFLRLQRTWKSGDKVEFDIDQRTSTVAIDPQTKDLVALQRGPQVLFAITDSPAAMSRKAAAGPQVSRTKGRDWQLQDGDRRTSLKPFYEIADETYQTYWPVESSVEKTKPSGSGGAT